MPVLTRRLARGGRGLWAGAGPDAGGGRRHPGRSPTDPTAPGSIPYDRGPTTAPQAEATTDLVTRLRHDVIPAAVAETGLDVKITARRPRTSTSPPSSARRVFLFFGAVLAVSFVLLVVFRSLLVPLKAVIMNALAMAATYGILVAVFQWGWGGELFGISGAPIEPFMPMILFAIVFGLSMDYEVFLLSRVREEYNRTGDPVESVADGLASTARVITAAAAIMVVVFGSFALEDDRLIKMLGTGLAVAVLLDVTLVRMVLVPATMELLGARNWWLPAWLDRILPRLSVERTGRPGDAPAPGQPRRPAVPDPPRPPTAGTAATQEHQPVDV